MHRHIEDHDHSLASMMDHVSPPRNRKYLTRDFECRTSCGNCLQKAARQTAAGVLEGSDGIRQGLTCLLTFHGYHLIRIRE